MKWQPPIPAGALYSPDALALGSGLALLAWCYDAIDRGGWVTINLHEIASELGVEYWTIKRWWSALRKGPFFQTVEEHGRKGTRARLANDWIDWRLIGTEAVANMRPNTIIGTETGAKSGPNTDNRDVIGTETSAIMLPNNSAYKESNIDQNQRVSTHDHGRDGEDRDGTARTLSHPAIKTWTEYFPDVDLDAKQIGRICSTATDGAVWRSVVELFSDNGWQPLPGNILDRYRKAVKERIINPSRSPNGSTHVAPARHVPTDPLPEPSKPTNRVRLKEISEAGKAKS